jgi:hypothetical protein
MYPTNCEDCGDKQMYEREYVYLKIKPVLKKCLFIVVSTSDD